MDTSRKIICPIITVWVIFILNLFLNYFYVFTFRENIFDIKNKYYIHDRYSRYSGYNGFAFFSLLINCLIELIASILVSLSFEKKKQRLYLIGLIMSLIFAIYMTISFIIACVREYKNISSYDNYYTKTEKGIFIFNEIFQILMNWSQFGVLILYFNKVKQSFNKSYLNPVLITDFPNQIQPSE